MILPKLRIVIRKGRHVPDPFQPCLLCGPKGREDRQVDVETKLEKYVWLRDQLDNSVLTLP